MKRAIGAVLAAVILMVSCLSGCGGGGWEKWDPSSLPHNSNLKLSDSKDQFLAADQVELFDEYEDQEDVVQIKLDMRRRVSTVQEILEVLADAGSRE